MQFLKRSLIMCCLLATVQAALGLDDKFARALSCFHKESYVEALQLFNDSVCSGEKESQRLYYSALCYLHTAQLKKGEELFQLILKNYPGSKAAELSQKYLKASSTVQSPAQSNRSGLNVEPRSSADPNDISIPFRKTAKGQLTVNAELQGRSMSMIFDTGAEECLFSKHQIETANLGNVEQSKPVILSSVAGPMKVFRITTEIKLGPLKKVLPVCVQDEDIEAGILGQPFLEGYSCLIDNQAGLIRLRRSGTAASAASLDSFSVPFRLDGGKIIVSARLKGRAIDMCFDTGSYGVCMSKKQAEDLGLNIPDMPPEHTHGPNGQQVPSWQSSADLSLGPIMKKAFPVRVIDTEISYPLLGQNFFGDRIFSIDRSKNEIHFAH